MGQVNVAEAESPGSEGWNWGTRQKRRSKHGEPGHHVNKVEISFHLAVFSPISQPYLMVSF